MSGELDSNCNLALRSFHSRKSPTHSEETADQNHRGLIIDVKNSLEYYSVPALFSETEKWRMETDEPDTAASPHISRGKRGGRWRKSGREMTLEEMSYQFKLNIRSKCCSARGFKEEEMGEGEEE